jgi:ArsR family transcriptional regulator, arsenate/arsenite/antimonite-responsive transcriptional repressor
MVTEKQTIIPLASDSNACCCCDLGHIPVDTNRVAANVKLLAALADPTRLAIVTMLSGLDEPLCVCEIVPHFELGQPTVSHHLKVLRDAGLVTWEKRGLWVYYALNREAMAGISQYLDGLLASTLSTSGTRHA